MADMSRTAKVVTRNGKDVPAELRDLPAGCYIVEPIDEEAIQNQAYVAGRSACAAPARSVDRA